MYTHHMVVDQEQEKSDKMLHLGKAAVRDRRALVESGAGRSAEGPSSWQWSNSWYPSFCLPVGMPVFTALRPCLGCLGVSSSVTSMTTSEVGTGFTLFGGCVAFRVSSQLLQAC